MSAALWLVAATATVAPSTECVELAGPPDVVAALFTLLAAPPPCRPVRAEIAPVDGGYEVRIHDGPTRTARSLGAAALILEAWATPSLTADLLSPPPAPRRVALSPDAPLEVTATPTVPSASSIALAVRLTGGATEVEAPSAGVLARVDLLDWTPHPWAGVVAMTGAGTFQGSDGTAAHRTRVAFLAGARWPIPLGPGALVPGLGLGFGFERTTRRNPDCTGPVCPRVIDDGFTHLAWSPRGWLELAWSLPLRDAFELEVAGSAEVVALVDDAPLPPYAGQLPLEQQRQVGLPPSSRWVAHLGVGARWRGP